MVTVTLVIKGNGSIQFTGKNRWEAEKKLWNYVANNGLRSNQYSVR